MRLYTFLLLQVSILFLVVPMSGQLTFAGGDLEGEAKIRFDQMKEYGEYGDKNILTDAELKTLAEKQFDPEVYKLFARYSGFYENANRTWSVADLLELRDRGLLAVSHPEGEKLARVIGDLVNRSNKDQVLKLVENTPKSIPPADFIQLYNSFRRDGIDLKDLKKIARFYFSVGKSLGIREWELNEIYQATKNSQSLVKTYTVEEILRDLSYNPERIKKLGAQGALFAHDLGLSEAQLNQIEQVKAPLHSVHKIVMNVKSQYGQEGPGQAVKDLLQALTHYDSDLIEKVVTAPTASGKITIPKAVEALRSFEKFGFDLSNKRGHHLYFDDYFRNLERLNQLSPEEKAMIGKRNQDRDQQKLHFLKAETLLNLHDTLKGQTYRQIIELSDQWSLPVLLEILKSGRAKTLDEAFQFARKLEKYGVRTHDRPNQNIDREDMDVLKKWVSDYERNKEKRKTIESIGTPLADHQRTFYRWGDYLWEKTRVQQNVPFNIAYGNYGNEKVGQGLYVAGDYQDSQQFGNQSKAPYLIKIQLPPNTKLIDFSDPQIEGQLKAAGVSKQDVISLNPHVLVKYPATTYVGPKQNVTWYAYKGPAEEKYEKFDGKEFTTEQLLKSIPEMNLNSRTRFRKMIYKELGNRIASVPPTEGSLVEPSACSDQSCCDHSSSSKLENQVRDLATSIQDLSPVYRWRYNGTCGEYFSKAGNLEFVQEVSIEKCGSTQIGWVNETCGKYFEDAEGHRVLVQEIPNSAACDWNEMICEPSGAEDHLVLARNRQGLFSQGVTQQLTRLIPGLKSFSCQELAKRVRHGHVCIHDESGYASIGLEKTNASSGINLSRNRGKPSHRAQLDQVLNDRQPFASLEQCESSIRNVKDGLMCAPGGKNNFEVKHAFNDPGNKVQFTLDHTSFTNLEQCHASLNTLASGWMCLPSSAGQFETRGIFPSNSDPAFSGKQFDSLTSCQKSIQKFEEKVFSDIKKEIFKSKDFNSDEIVKAFEAFPDLKQYYQSSAGVSEGYTVGEHTRMVLDQFKDQYAHFRLNQLGLPPEVSQDRLIPLLKATVALHDIGKPLGPPESQHYYTTPILERRLAQLGFTEAEVKLGKALVDQDYLGEYMQSKVSSQVLKEKMQQLAYENSMNLSDYYQLQKFFFTIDASSYPALKKRVFDVQSGGLLTVRPPNVEEFTALEEKILKLPVQ